MRSETPLEIAWDAWCADYGYLNYARSRYHELFAAGFTAGVAHANATADPARVARLESLLRKLREEFRTHVNGTGYSDVSDDELREWQTEIAALLGGVDGTE